MEAPRILDKLMALILASCDGYDGGCLGWSAVRRNEFGLEGETRDDSSKNRFANCNERVLLRGFVIRATISRRNHRGDRFAQIGGPAEGFGRGSKKRGQDHVVHHLDRRSSGAAGERSL